MHFKIIGKIENEQTFASGSGIREIARLRKIYGAARWRTRNGTAEVHFKDGTSKHVELHWYEASVIGRKEYKIKRILK